MNLILFYVSFNILQITLQDRSRSLHVTMLPSPCRHKEYDMCADCGDDGYCTAPDHCVCAQSYTFPDECNQICHDFYLTNCQLFDTCTCYSGFKLQYPGGPCIPVCNNYKNGNCIAPRTCICIPGYSSIDHGPCEPDCIGCKYGKCTLPNNCVCLKGYFGKYCEKIQCNNCMHGKCNTPNKCECNDNYSSKGPRGPCEPDCNGCIHGKCKSPNNCSCDDGYNGLYCDIPYCKNCKNGNCTAPETCICHQGYIKTKPNNTCEPICNQCVNGDCIQPNTCKCFDGYFSSKPGGPCQPCKGCLNKICAMQNQCASYKINKNIKKNKLTPFKSDLLKPICENCINGKCVSQNKCKCHLGYYESSDHNICLPMCTIRFSTGEITVAFLIFAFNVMIIILTIYTNWSRIITIF